MTTVFEEIEQSLRAQLEQFVATHVSDVECYVCCGHLQLFNSIGNLLRQCILGDETEQSEASMSSDGERDAKKRKVEKSDLVSGRAAPERCAGEGGASQQRRMRKH